MKKAVWIFSLFSFLFCLNTQAQLTVDSSKTVEQLINDVLLGGGVKISNISYTGSIKARGSFDGSKSNIGINYGVILSSGDIKEAIGPNNKQSAPGLGFGLPGDTDLDAILTNGFKTKDAAVLEFDFIPVSDSVKFNYVFASDEYGTSDCAIFNDIFSFMLSGPNPSGGNYNKKNIALVPNTSTPVAINSVNGGTIGPASDSLNCIAMDPNWRAYSKYYRNNGDGSSTYPQFNDSTVVQYNGFTQTFTAKAAIVPCQLYHIKLAIADVGDAQSSSAVFLEAKSFSGGLKVITDQNTANNKLTEGCTGSALRFVRFAEFDSLVEINYLLKGDAQKNIDYTDLSGSSFNGKITFNKLLPPYPASDTITLDFKAPFDALHENDETLQFQVINTLACAADTIKIDYKITNSDSLSYTISGDQDICIGESTSLTPLIQNGHRPFLYNWNSGESNDSVFTKSFSLSETIYLSISDACQIPNKSISAPVNIHEAANSNWLADSNCAKNNIIFSNSTQWSDGYVTNYLWSIDNNELAGENATHEFHLPGNYEVTLITTTNFGCTDTITKAITIIDCDLHAYSIITMNNDGLNDYFLLHDLNHDQWKLKVYNRWGLKIYSSENYQNDWKPESISSGVYFYSFEKLNSPVFLNGYVHILE
jgi:hypothetical protein